MSKTSKAGDLDTPVIGPQLIEAAKDIVFYPTPPSQFPCRVCGTSGATERSDGLCWVCRRLKISAWRSADPSDSPAE